MLHDDDGDLEELSPGQFVQRRELRAIVEGAAFRVIANIKLRQLLARRTPLGCPEVSAGRSAFFYKPAGRSSAPRWCGPAAVVDIDELGVTVKFRRQALGVAKFCGRKRMDPKNAGDVEWNSSSKRSDEMAVWPLSALGKKFGRRYRAVGARG